MQFVEIRGERNLLHRVDDLDDAGKVEVVRALEKIDQVYANQGFSSAVWLYTMLVGLLGGAVGVVIQSHGQLESGFPWIPFLGMCAVIFTLAWSFAQVASYFEAVAQRKLFGELHVMRISCPMVRMLLGNYELMNPSFAKLTTKYSNPTPIAAPTVHTH